MDDDIDLASIDFTPVAATPKASSEVKGPLGDALASLAQAHSHAGRGNGRAAISYAVDAVNLLAANFDLHGYASC